MVPVGREENTKQRITVESTATCENVYENIYEAIGCQSVAKKPILKYKFAWACNANSMHFRQAADWETMKEDFHNVAKAWKTDVMVIADIIIEEQVCFQFLKLQQALSYL